jgi:hypothetical protein
MLNLLNANVGVENPRSQVILRKARGAFIEFWRKKRPVESGRMRDGLRLNTNKDRGYRYEGIRY